VKLVETQVKVKVLLIQLDALASNSVRMRCKVTRDSVEVKVLLFQLGTLAGNSVRMRCKVARDSVEVKVLLIERDESQVLKRFIRLPLDFVKDFPLEL